MQKYLGYKKPNVCIFFQLYSMIVMSAISTTKQIQKIKTKKMKQTLPFPGEGWAELSPPMLPTPGTFPLQAIEHNLK